MLNPAWHVPRSILSKDILPKLGRDPAYLDREQFEVIDGEGNPVQFSEDGWHHALASVSLTGCGKSRGSQCPGSLQVLSAQQRCHLSPLHPAQGAVRAGGPCLQLGLHPVEHADDLAELLLADSRYQPDKVASILKETQTKWLPLSNPIPVFTVYWSSWIDEEGRQQLRNDIYGFDRVSYQSRLL